MRNKIDATLNPPKHLVTEPVIVRWGSAHQKLFVKETYEEAKADLELKEALIIVLPRRAEVEGEFLMDPYKALLKESTMASHVQKHIFQTVYMGPLILGWADAAAAGEEKTIAESLILWEDEAFTFLGMKQKELVEGMHCALAKKPSSAVANMMSVDNKITESIRNSSWWQLKLKEHAALADIWKFATYDDASRSTSPGRLLS